MLISALIATVALGSDDPIELYRKWSPSETLEYSISARLTTETRDFVNTVFMLEVNKSRYNFTLDVNSVSDEGFAKAEYKKPTVTITIPETFRKKAYDKVEEVNEHLELSISPVNAVTDVKDLNPKEEEDDDGDGGGGGGIYPNLSFNLNLPPQDPSTTSAVLSVINGAMSEFYKVASFAGSIQTMLDFAPRLSLFEVEPGDTWEHTASYQPQPLEGKDDKMAPQRIDYIMTYVGVETVDGKEVHRITSDLKYETDIAPFINALIGMKSSESGLTGFKVNMTAEIIFDLDLETKHTIRAIGKSKGSVKVEVTDVPGRPYQESKVTGVTILKLVPKAKPEDKDKS